jgi:hypothetical protein
MAEIGEITSEHLGTLLQISRDFALQQISENGGFIPFGTQVKPDGDTDFIRMADDDTEGSMEDFFHFLQLALTERAQQGEIVAAATVINILAASAGVEIEPGFDRAIRVHVESPGFSRAVIAPYRIEADAEDGKSYIMDGAMVAIQEVPVVFAG